MYGKCWSIQYIGHEDYKLRDKVHTGPVYFTAKAAMKAIRDWIDEMNENECINVAHTDHITEEFLANTEPGYWDEIYQTNDACVSIVIICHRIA